jgi:hypothetical protein
MAGIGNTYVDLIDVYKSKDPDGSIADVIEMLMELNPMLKDAYAVECNNGTTHRHTIRTGLPGVAWGKLYQGIAQGKSQKAQVDDSTGFVEGMSTIDKRVLSLSGSPAELRLSEAKAYLESIAQEIQATMIYGDTTSAPEEFMGLEPRFNDLSANNANQIIDAGGTGSDNMSIWFVTWADNAVHTIYPKGTMAGVEREDKGEQRVLDGSSNPYYVMEEMFTQHCGMAVKDWRYVSRIANIDASVLAADPTDVDGSGNDLYHFMRKAYYALESRRHPAGGKICCYMNTDALEALDALGTNAGGSDTFVRLKPMEIQGEEIQGYRGIPIRETDALHIAEARVT